MRPGEGDLGCDAYRSILMSTKALENKVKKKSKFRVRQYTRCELCGRSRAVYRKFRICRICFRTLANEGKIPGVKKASW